MVLWPVDLLIMFGVKYGKPLNGKFCQLLHLLFTSISDSIYNQAKETRDVVLQIIIMTEKEKRFKCKLCEYRSPYSSNLNRHIKERHRKIRDHPCNECGKSFPRMEKACSCST